jgi:carbon monoxide dehydrogenase subunit G
MTLVDEQRPKQAAYEGKGEVPGGSATIRAEFQLEELPGGQTRVKWAGHSSVLGRVISLAGGLLEPLGKKNVQKLIDGLQKALA